MLNNIIKNLLLCILLIVVFLTPVVVHCDNNSQAFNISEPGVGGRDCVTSPWIVLQFPRGGERLCGSHYIRWEYGGISNSDIGVAVNIHNADGNWTNIAREITEDYYQYDFSPPNVEEGTYYIRVELWQDTNSDNKTYQDLLLAHDKSSWFTVDCNFPPTTPRVSGPKYGESRQKYEYTAVSTDIDGDEISYRLAWGDGETVTTDFYPSGQPVYIRKAWSEEGIYTITARANDGMASSNDTHLIMTIDDTAPYIELQKPQPGFYIYDSRMLFPLPRPFIFGGITIEATASDEKSGIKKVTFFIDNQLQSNDTILPYEWYWDMPSSGKHTIKIVAYDMAGHTASKKQIVWGWNT